MAGFAEWQGIDVGTARLLPEIERHQRRVAADVRRLQHAICLEVAQGVVETLGLRAWAAPGDLGVWVALPAGADIAQVAWAIVAEGAVAQPADDAPYLLLPVQPWFDLEEIEHTVLCCAKVCHVLLGVHPPTLDLAAHLADGSSCHWTPQPSAAGADFPREEKGY